MLKPRSCASCALVRAAIMNKLLGAFVILAVWSDMSHGYRSRYRAQRVSAGEPVILKPNAPQQRLLAEHSLGVFVVENDEQPLKLVEVVHATEQLVNGLIYRLNFTVSPLEGHYPAGLFACNSEVYVPLLKGKNSYTVNCDLQDIDHRPDGAPTEDDVTNPVFLYYAQKALDLQVLHYTRVAQKVIKVEKQTTTLPRFYTIDFLGSGSLHEVESVGLCSTKVTLAGSGGPVIRPAYCGVQ